MKKLVVGIGADFGSPRPPGDTSSEPTISAVWTANVPGKVIVTNNNPISYGAGPYNIVIKAGDFVVLFGELLNEKPLFDINETIEPGTVVGHSDEHIHFEIRPAPPDGHKSSEKSNIYINPLTFFEPALQTEWVKLFAGDYAVDSGQDPLSLGYYTSFPADCP